MVLWRSIERVKKEQSRQALKHLLPAFGPRLLCDIAARDIEAYQTRRKREGAQGRTINMETGVLERVLRMYRL